ncbi:LPS assembly lipoprotein LptE [uncultured Paraglaciecola sp.]|uniref:LPS-assembly lipoprotein LptE n=1 Tax=uncultured Paraglaciecola sp. TaxID=1765024 RepID=UPI00259A34CA|nr:LPS assembly lipoprotein LptE [uncultured Paraglaciecola sp.]
MKLILGKGLVLSALMALFLSSCGFKLRGDYNLPSEIKQLELTAEQKNTPLYRVLRKQLEGFDIEVFDNALKANISNDDIDARVYLKSDQLERRLLSLFSTGQVAEYELVYTIKYLIQLPDEDPQVIEFDITREYQDDPDAVLAKSRELDLIQKEMRQAAALRIISQLASSYTSWQQVNHS